MIIAILNVPLSVTTAEICFSAIPQSNKAFVKHLPMYSAVWDSWSSYTPNVPIPKKIVYEGETPNYL